MEARLREYVTTDESGKYPIRSLECRTSVCVVEVGSTFGPYFGVFRDGDALYKRVSAEIGAIGYETQPDGSRVTVTLMPYTRY
jgi:hypothetical protein